ncbi:MAG: HAD family hydrolase [Candidatus Competibacterales bacterium]
MATTTPESPPWWERPCWIFDLDGTLTEAVHDFGVIRAELGVPDSADIIHYLEELPLVEALPLWRRLLAIEGELVAATRPAPGLELLMEGLGRRGVRLGVLTRNTRGNAWRCLEHLQVAHLFRPEWVLGRDEAAPKPDPGGIQWLLERWGATPDQGVMVGDYRYDLLAGRAAGVATVHVAVAGEFPWPELTDVAVSTLAELHGRLVSPA